MQDGGDRSAQFGQRLLTHAVAAPRDVVVRPDEKRSVVIDLANARPLPEHVVVVAAGAHTVHGQLDVELQRQLFGDLSPRPATFSDDETQPAVSGEIDGGNRAATMVEPGVGDPGAWMCGGLVVQLGVALRVGHGVASSMTADDA